MIVPGDTNSGPDISVIVCSYNGATRLPECLRALEHQSIRQRMEVLVVDDGSSDGTSHVAERFGARVLRHPTNRGLAAARNTGVRAALGELVMFTDDDMIPREAWAERLEQALGAGVAVAGGGIDMLLLPGLLAGYLARNNPFTPLELSLGRNDGPLRRLAKYVSRQWAAPLDEARDVSAIMGGNFACRRSDLLAVGLFDEHLVSGEEYQICWRLIEHFPQRRIVFQPSARGTHVTQSSARSVLRRAQCYGRGACDLFIAGRVKSPTLFFMPLLEVGLVAASRRRPYLLIAAILGPHILFPKGPRLALSSRRASAALDPYIQIGIEAAHDVGFAQSLAGLTLSRATGARRGSQKPAAGRDGR